MALALQLAAKVQNLSGKLTVTAPPGELEALQTLAIELSERPGFITHGNIIAVPPTPIPPEPETPDPPQPAPNPGKGDA
jgi:hypothetical protein